MKVPDSVQQNRRIANPRDTPARKHAGGRPSYISSPRIIYPAARGPRSSPSSSPDTPSATGSTRATTTTVGPQRRQVGNPKLVPAKSCIRSTKSRQVAPPPWALPGCFAPALPNAEVPVGDGGLWGAGAQGWARSGAGTDADAVGKVRSAKLDTRCRFT